MSEHSNEIDLDRLMQWRITVEDQIKETNKAVEDQIKTTNEAIKALQDERTKALKWGITVLGAAVMAMGSWMWSFLMGHIK